MDSHLDHGDVHIRLGLASALHHIAAGQRQGRFGRRDLLHFRLQAGVIGGALTPEEPW